MEEVARTDLGTYGRMVLMAPPALQELYPGQDVVGQVTLTLRNHPFLLRGLWCKLSGMSTISHLEKEVACVDLMQGEEDHHNGGVVEVLAGFGETDLHDQGELLELNEATYTWPFCFKIPSGAPYSHADKHAEVVYSLSCTLDSPAVCKADAQLCHTIIVGSTNPEALPPFQVPPNILETAGAADGHSQACQWDEQSTSSSGWSVSRLLSRLFGRGNGGSGDESRNEKSNITMQLTSDRPAVFPFSKAKITLPVCASLRCPAACRRQLQAGTVKMTARVVLLTSLRKDVFASFAEAYEIDEIDAEKMAKLWARRRSVALRQVLWESVRDGKRSQSTDEEDDDAALTVMMQAQYDVPLRIDSKHRQTCLSSWPQPLPIQHEAASNERLAACLYSFSSESPLSKLAYYLEVEAWSQPTKGKSRLLCRRRAEIFLHAPLHSPDALSEDEGRTPGTSGNTTAASSPSTSSPQSPRQVSVPNAVPPTPHASLAPVRVVGELLSRGPAALLMDRGQAAPREEFVTPQRFAPLHQVVAQGVDVVPGTPAFTPAIAFLLSPRTDAEMQSGAPPVFSLPLALTVQGVSNSSEESKEEPSPSQTSIRLVSPVPGNAVVAAEAFVVATASSSPVQQIMSASISEPVIDTTNFSPSLVTFLSVLPAEGQLLARLQSQTVYHTLPLRSLGAVDTQALLLLVPSSADRETALFLLLHEGCLEPGADVDLLVPGGCLDTCFPMSVQKERIKTQVRMGVCHSE